MRAGEVYGSLIWGAVAFLFWLVIFNLVNNFKEGRSIALGVLLLFVVLITIVNIWSSIDSGNRAFYSPVYSIILAIVHVSVAIIIGMAFIRKTPGQNAVVANAIKNVTQ